MEFCGHKALNSLPKGLPFAKGVFDEFRDKDFLPAYLVDPNRDFLDRRVNCDLLGFDEDNFQAVRRLSPGCALSLQCMAGRGAQRVPVW